MIDTRQVANAHDAMVAEYDDIEDLWYSYLFNRIHGFIVSLLPYQSYGTALDVGCGTGFQSFLLAYAGYRVRGFDLAARLVTLAEQKANKLELSGKQCLPLYKSSLPGVYTEQMAILRAASKLRSSPIIRPEFFVADATLPKSYEPGNYDVIVCCGSVLSFIDQYEETLRKMVGALRQKGMIFLEVEQRLNGDLIWPFIDVLLGGVLHFEQNPRKSVKNLFTKPGENIRVDFPFDLVSGGEVTLPLWLFSVGSLKKQFAKLGLTVKGHLGIHGATNLIPSTILHRQYPGRSLRLMFRPLAAIERLLGDKWPLWRLGCSVVYALEKK